MGGNDRCGVSSFQPENMVPQNRLYAPTTTTTTMEKVNENWRTDQTGSPGGDDSLSPYGTKLEELLF